MNIRKKSLSNFVWFLMSKIIKAFIPLNARIWIRERIDESAGVTFDGWGMKIIHRLPWSSNSAENESFVRASQDIKRQFEFSGDDGVSASGVDGLLWRHWVVSYCVRHAVEFTNKDLDMVECGTCDGLTAFFILRELRGLNSKARMHLYDAWAPMRSEFLLESEQQSVGRYSNISIQRVRNNLSEFNNVIYHPGYIPESLYADPPSPDKISFLHIDLNSANPTIATLEYFFPRLMQEREGGVILFDDYGDINYSPTKKAVDRFFAGKPGILMPLPTGQAIYYK